MLSNILFKVKIECSTVICVLQEEVCRKRGGVNASVSWDSGISGLSAITRLEGETGPTATWIYTQLCSDLMM